MHENFCKHQHQNELQIQVHLQVVLDFLLKNKVKHVFTNITQTEPSPVQEYCLLQASDVDPDSDPDRPNRHVNVSVDDFGPTRDTIKTTVLATGIEKMENASSNQYS